MYRFRMLRYFALASLTVALTNCKVPAMVQVHENRTVPQTFDGAADSASVARLQWRNFFTDNNLIALIDTALKNNQELRMTLQEIEISRSEIRLRQGQLLPTVGVRAGTGIDKVGRYTSQGAGDVSTEITPGKEIPEALTDFSGGAYARWEIDIWNKLHNARKAAVERLLASVEGKNFVITNLISEVANSYYELLALDVQLEIVKQNIDLQKNALEIIKVQKEAARTTELAVQKFQAEVLNSQSLEYDILQKIKQAENNINLLLARYPRPIPRDKSNFLTLVPASISVGTPAQLLANRPDIQQAEFQLSAAKLDVKVARAEFYPSLGITAALGFQAFNPAYLVKLPESMIFSIAGDLAAPLINRNAIKAEYSAAGARQLQAMYNYERTVLSAYLEVSTELSRLTNLGKSYELKALQVDALTRSINISNELFKSARADYLEVLMTQRDALESKLELVETKKQQLSAVINVYRDLGGGLARN